MALGEAAFLSTLITRGVGVVRTGVNCCGELFFNWTPLGCSIRRDMQHFAEKAFGCLGIAGGTQEELQRVPRRIHSPIEVRPDFLYFNVGLIDTPGIVCG